MKRGQTWSMDFALSLVMFTAAAIVAYTIIANTIRDDSHDEVQRQAADAAALLAGEGYPQHWTNDTLIRSGLAAGDRFSLRKATEMASLTSSQLRKSLRATDFIYVYLTNESNATLSLFGTCGIGDLTVQEFPKNQSLPATALAGSAHLFTDLLRNITVYENTTGFLPAKRSDVVVVEANLSAYEGITESEISIFFDTLAQHGITILVIGDPGVPILGIETLDSDTADLQVQGYAGENLGLLLDEVLNVSMTPITVRAVQKPMQEEIANYREVALTDEGDAAFATWTYRDARVWYFATVDGTTSSGAQLAETIANATLEMIERPRPDCGAANLPTNATQVAFHDRTLAHHDTIVRVRTLVWRSR